MFTTIVIQPLYNALIYIVNFLPNHELWIAMVIVTVLFKILLIPFFKKQIRDQVVLTHLAPKMKDLQEKYKDNREQLSREMLAIYSKYKVNPLLSILILLIQLPFLIGLYQIFYYDLSSYQNLLYTGLTLPGAINKMFFGIDLGQISYVLAVLAGASQYILGLYMFKEKTGKEKEQETEFVRAMSFQMKYFLPIMMVFISVVTPAVIALYLIVTNIFGIVQEIIIKNPLEKKVKQELAEEK